MVLIMGLITDRAAMDFYVVGFTRAIIDFL